jgi:hypothetical protein
MDSPKHRTLRDLMKAFHSNPCWCALVEGYLVCDCNRRGSWRIVRSAVTCAPGASYANLS